MRLCITEKPSVARDIAQILGANERHDGYFEGGDWRVTWTFGHLCCLFEPDDYKAEWKRWALSLLPMLPERYDIKLIDDAGYKHQFGVIERLIGEADEVVNCGDAGQEGELIQRWVMKKAGTSCPVRRLWISSLTDESIREGFSSLKPQADYDKLFQAGMCRAIGDWILGMNATRLYTLKYGGRGQVLSIGRVQTPTLALIVKRHREIAQFVPTDSWELHTRYREVDFTYTGDRFDKPEPGEETVARIAAEPFVIKSVTKKKGRESAPRLFDLTSLQVECNKRFAWTAEQTLKLIQSLYEKKLTTYPRVDTTYLSDDMHPKIAPTLKKMAPYAAQIAPILAKPIPKSKKIFDNAKVTDHHAIIPTGQSPSGLDGDERRLYHLIAMRFIGVFYPDCEFESTVVTGQAADCEFKASGKVIVSPGWRVLQPTKNDSDSKQDEDSAVLPVFTVGESGPHTPSLVKKTSQPPKYYTEGTLLRAMETAGRTVDDDELRDALKENGIGRPSTRANIIETLFRRRYIYRERKNIMATEAGIALIDTIQEELLKSAKLTGIWENKLRLIERGAYSPGLFINEISSLMREIVTNVLSDNSATRIAAAPEEKKDAPKATKAAKPRSPRTTKFEQVECPVCGQGHIIKGRSAFGCSRYADGCQFRLSFTDCPAESTPAKVKKFISKSTK